MALLPSTAVASNQLEGSLGRLELPQAAARLRRLAEALDLQLLEPWQKDL
jgi:hypothetical protein